MRRVARLLERAGEVDQPLQMTEANCAEVQYIVRRKDGDAAWEAVARELSAAPIEFHAIDRRLADGAAHFKARYRISLADAFAAALAKERNASLVTGDREFRPLEKEIRITWLHPPA
ncbi:MAG: PIN domain-containing protein [Limisphaerales bacterium]